jgi:hypothetical protein
MRNEVVMTMTTTRTNRRVIVVGDVEITVIKRHLSQVTEKTYFANTRVYVAEQLALTRDERLRDLYEQERNLGATRNATRGLYPTVDRLYNTLNRQHARVAVTIAVDELTRQELIPADVTGKHSKYAGCSCPCSPGVILSRRIISEDGCPLDFWLTLHK